VAVAAFLGVARVALVVVSYFCHKTTPVCTPHFHRPL
jgi:hypothetical protein